jgi:hypothetical protein
MATITGILIIILAAVHIVFGEIVQIRDLRQFLGDPVIIGSTRVMIYQGGIILLGVGIIQILKGIGRIKLTGFASCFPVAIVCMNILTFAAIALISRNGLLRAGLPQLAVFLVIIGLMIAELKRSATGNG